MYEDPIGIATFFVIFKVTIKQFVYVNPHERSIRTMARMASRIIPILFHIFSALHRSCPDDAIAAGMEIYPT
jgi:hypothetical protein